MAVGSTLVVAGACLWLMPKLLRALARELKPEFHESVLDDPADAPPAGLR